jgi:hypothetical protein
VVAMNPTREEYEREMAELVSKHPESGSWPSYDEVYGREDILIYKADEYDCGGYEISCTPEYFEIAKDRLWMEVGFPVPLDRVDVYDGRYDGVIINGREYDEED